MRQLILPYVILFLSILLGCGGKNAAISYKNHCYDDALTFLRHRNIYREVHQAFVDTFQVMKDYKAFTHKGAQHLIDDAIFFKKDSTECLLLVLERNELSPLFGFARVIHAENVSEKWSFSLGMEFSYSEDYYQLYSENNFDNLSRIARYSVLTKGKPAYGGCSIDDHFWFVEMSD